MLLIDKKETCNHVVTKKVYLGFHAIIIPNINLNAHLNIYSRLVSYDAYDYTMLEVALLPHCLISSPPSC